MVWPYRVTAHSPNSAGEVGLNRGAVVVRAESWAPAALPPPRLSSQGVEQPLSVDKVMYDHLV